MSKTIDLNRSVYELATEYPEIADIMAELGFTEIKKPAMLNSVGRLTTIPKGAKMKNIPVEKVVFALIDHGFTLSGKMPDIVAGRADAPDEAAEEAPQDKAETEVGTSNARSRTEQLKSYLRRLGSGESLESVRADFAESFRDVDASEIMQAEQELMKEGTPLEEVQKLCDVHSALFHGATVAEYHAAVQEKNSQAADCVGDIKGAAADDEGRIAEVTASVKRAQELGSQRDYSNKNEIAAQLAAVEGHPLNTLARENEMLSGMISTAKAKLEVKEELGVLFTSIRELSIHYAKKGDLLYPLLKVKYEISGPSDVMWTVDDEIRDEFGELAKTETHDAAWEERLRAVIQRADEMIYKENNILFHICAVNFSADEWYGIYRDSKDYADCLGIKPYTWNEAEAWEAREREATGAGIDRSAETDGVGVSGEAHAGGEIVMPGGHLRVDQLTALLNTIPVEITFVDADNINRFFNEGPKVFKRPGMALDREVFLCHPPKIEPMVRGIIDDFREGRRDIVPVWMEKSGRTMLVRYMAVRSGDGEYLGTVELVQDMEFAKEHFAQQ